MKPAITSSQVAAFRLERHHLLRQRRSGLVTVCRDTGGIQAQLISAARVSLWTRSQESAISQIEAALTTSRTLVRTSLMRQTLHIIPSADFAMYISALRRSRRQALMRIMGNYFGITRSNLEALNRAIADALRPGPMTQRELRDELKPLFTAKLRKLADKSWSIQIFRSALVEGLICYGPERGKDATFVRVSTWLPKLRSISEYKAKQELLRRYLRVYGPATVQDFARWAGYPISEAKEVWNSVNEELAEISVEAAPGWILRSDIETLAQSKFNAPVLRLLPAFDSFLLGHADKRHLVDRRHYKQVYRNQGWISPVVLLNGRVIGIWSHKLQTRSPSIELTPFKRPSATVQSLVKREIKKIEQFLHTTYTVRYAR